jgi:hypothetical protein
VEKAEEDVAVNMEDDDGWYDAVEEAPPRGQQH